ncbi:hypothetical protein PR048_018701 [Dryococelus australis]|uniref:Reverse transcriptase RNase H-like domain-containing protein n=1 Tax=Dryococelus australis TaxID=614101 RepID=A0ABQ9HD26_9NEOP|nr:hypothetical protein PR048_018701 [Dryococelus australis]
MEPLNDIFKKNHKCRLTVDKQNSFGTQRISCSNAFVVGLGAVLYQEGENGERHVITYMSISLSDTKMLPYHFNKLECLAIISLILLHTACTTRSKFGRWTLKLKEFTFEIQHFPGNKNKLHMCYRCRPTYIDRSFHFTSSKPKGPTPYFC